ncbi:MAG: phosphatidate cytidylyltransferase [Clostridia bacterium]|nr:phosphatidate cytidylyltransferase [Clostridia bacterium]
MLKRIITGVVAFALFLPILVFSGHEIGKYVFMAVIGALALIATDEMCGCFSVRKVWFISIPTYLFAIGTTLITIFFRGTSMYIPYLVCAAFAFAFIVFVASMFNTGKVKYTAAAAHVATVLYVICGFLSIIGLRYVEMGTYLFYLIFIGSWCTDSFAYFVGVAIGKHKLIPQVSPKKTVEGAIGGVLGAVIGFLVYGVCLAKFADNVTVNYVAMAISAVGIAVVSQLGDLVTSFIKREQGIKDYGKVLPGHGGIMDRFDSIIAVAPIITAIVTVLGVELLK